VALDAGGIRLVASITVEAADELGLTEGTQVIAIVKSVRCDRGSPRLNLDVDA
jgi:molybdopterin-binding protein